MRPATRLVFAACAALLAVHHPAPAAGSRTLADSTVVDAWPLANGLRVVTRHVPRAAGIAITLVHPAGGDRDPPGREGLARLAAEVAFMGPAGDVPERTRAEMPSLRPRGWNFKVAPTYTEFTEIASLEQFPGVLRQVATRMRGVTVTPDVLRAAVAAVVRDLEEAFVSEPGFSLHHQARLLAAGTDPDAIARLASGKGVQRAGVKEVQERIGELRAPAGTVLALAGDLAGYDVRRLVETEFGGLPARAPPPAAAPRPLRPGVHHGSHPRLAHPAVVVGVLAPALDDTLHPSFYLHALIFGAFGKSRWGSPPPPLATRFEYSLFDEPGLARFYPPVPPSPDDPAGEEVASVLREAASGLRRDVYDTMRGSVEWLLGGPLPRELARRVRVETGPLYTLCSDMAVRELWGGEEFWGEYRRRFLAASERDLGRWLNYFIAPDHRVELRLTPAP